MTHSPLPPLPASKLFPPRRGRGVLPRPRLEDLAPALLEHTLTVVKAPPGFGKTTLAATWAEALAARGLTVAWLTLDDSDDTPQRLVYCLAAALQRAAPDLGGDCLGLEKELPFVPADTLAALLVNDLCRRPGPFLLVLDDCQQVAAATLAAALRTLLRHAPAHLHLLLCSRTALPDELLLHARGTPVPEFDAEQLRFTAEETRDLLQRSGLALEAGDASAVQEATGGWSAALRAYLLAARHRPQDSRAALPRNLGLLFDEMLAGLSPEFRAQLLPLGLVEKFSAPMLAHCLGPGADDLIAALEQGQFFISTHAPDGAWFSLHPLFREHLARQLERDAPERAQAFRADAADWLARQGQWSEAITLAFAAGAEARAEAWIRHCAMDLVEQGDFLTLLQWEQRLRARLLALPAPLRLALAWAAALAMQHETAQHLLATLADAGDVSPWECRALRAMLLALEDHPAAGTALAAECLPELDGRPWIRNVLLNVMRYGHLRAGNWSAFYAVPPVQAEPLARSRYAFNRLYQQCIEAVADATQGHLEGAGLRLETAVAELEAAGTATPMLRALPSALLARVRLLQGEPEAAATLLANSLEFVRLGGFLDCMEAAFGTQARLLRLRDQPLQARLCLEEMEALAQARHWPRLLATALLERCRLCLQEQRLQEARSCRDRLQALQREAGAGATMASAAVLASLAVAGATAELPAELMADAEALAAQCGAAHFVLPQLELQVAIAAALHQAGHPGAAQARIAEWQEALQRSGARGLLGLLPEALRAPAPAMPASAAARAPLHELTVKERLILQEVARGQSNKEIARALGVGPETIKTHMKSIFAKLGVGSRAEAAVLAQQATASP